MLVLTRHESEAIVIAYPGRERPIRIVVLKILGPRSVKIGIEADRDINVAREEVALQEESEEAQPG
ncbi:MAG: carbon storage regulator [Chloroflexi bacterium]|nr:carbon storage regulator [Chloroflexota bacterium]